MYCVCRLTLQYKQIRVRESENKLLNETRTNLKRHNKLKIITRDKIEYKEILNLVDLNKG